MQTVESVGLEISETLNTLGIVVVRKVVSRHGELSFLLQRLDKQMWLRLQYQLLKLVSLQPKDSPWSVLLSDVYFLMKGAAGEDIQGRAPVVRFRFDPEQQESMAVGSMALRQLIQQASVLARTQAQAERGGAGVAKVEEFSTAKKKYEELSVQMPWENRRQSAIANRSVKGILETGGAGDTGDSSRVTGHLKSEVTGQIRTSGEGGPSNQVGFVNI